MKTEPNASRPLPLYTKISYGFGSVADGGKNALLGSLLLFYFTQVQGLSGTLAGAAIFIALLVDGITDPVVGSLSDNHHSRFGRRHPFIYASILPFGLCFYFLFNAPATLSQTQLFFWLLVFLVGARVCITLYIIPSNAMLAELTDDFDERTRISSWRYLFGWFGSVAVLQLALRAFLKPTEEFADGRFNMDAYSGLALAVAIIIMLAILVCAIGTHRRIPYLNKPPRKTSFSFSRLLKELKGPFSNRSYIMLVFAGLFAYTGVGYYATLTFYLETYFWELSTSQIALFFLPMGLAVLTGFWVASPLVARFDKKKATIITGIFYMLFVPAPLYLRLLGFMPENNTPALLPVYMIFVYLSTTCSVSNGIILGSMYADVIDENELNTGLRQEGIFNSANAFIIKSISGIGGLLAGVVLDIVSFPKNSVPGEVPEEILVNLALIVGPGTTLLMLVSVFFIANYRISRERYQEILTELSVRKASSTSSKSFLSTAG